MDSLKERFSRNSQPPMPLPPPQAPQTSLSSVSSASSSPHPSHPHASHSYSHSLPSNSAPPPASSLYGRPSYPTTSSAPPPGHQSTYAAPIFDKARPHDGPSDPYSTRVYPGDQPALPIAPPIHTRHHSASSAPPGLNPLDRSMPPPQSPTQPSGQPPRGGRPPYNYSQPPAQTRPPQPSPGLGYMGGRELPALGSRTSGTTSSSMSISAMLGGGASRDAPGPSGPPHGYPSGPAQGPPSNNYASPRMQHPQGPPGPPQQGPPQGPPSQMPPQEYQGHYGRPRTPEQGRFDPSRSTHTSPRNVYKQEPGRYNTPQYHPQGPPPPQQQRSMQLADPRDVAAREAAVRASMSQAPPGGSVPPPSRPSSQPKAYPMPRPGEEPPRHVQDHYRREEPGRAPMQMGYETRFQYERPDQDPRSRAPSVRERGPPGPDPRMQSQQGPDYGQGRGGPPPSQYGRGPDAGHWQRPGYDAPRPHYNQPGQMRQHDYPPNGPGQYPSHGGPQYPSQQQPSQSPRQRPGPAPHQHPGHPGQQQQQQSTQPSERFMHPQANGPPMHNEYLRSPERSRMNVMPGSGPPPHHVQHQQRSMHSSLPGPPRHEQHQESGSRQPPVQYGNMPPASHGGPGPTSNPTSAPYDPAQQQRIKPEEHSVAPMLQRSNSLLAIQESNRNKGRSSPLPQAVQGAQPLMPGPAADAGIKSEFNRVFSGLNPSLGLSSPVTSSFATGSHEATGDAADPRTKGRKKKSRDEAPVDEDARASGGKAKRVKTHQHAPHHHHHRHHHHHHHHGPDGQAIKSTKAAEAAEAQAAAETLQQKHVVRPETSGNSVQLVAPPPVVIPKQKPIVVLSEAVLETLADKPSYHLGDILYESRLVPERLVPTNPTNRGYRSNPRPLPLSMIKGKIDP